jgi:putative DNA primase/helicase
VGVDISDDFGPLDPPDPSDPWGPAGPPEPPDLYEGPGDPWAEHAAEPDEIPESQLVLRVDPSSFVHVSDRGRVTIRPASAANTITAAAAIAVAEDGRFWAEFDGVWQPSPRVIRNAMAASMGNQYDGRAVRDVEDITRTIVPMFTVSPHPAYINLRNGMLHSTSTDRYGLPSWSTWEFVGHRPQVHSTVQLPHNYDPAADCPRFDAALADWLEPDAVELAWEVIAACIYSGIPVQRAVMLQGLPGCGKSQLLDVITGLLGERNATHIPLQNLGERFNVAQLHGKALNVHADLDQAGVGETGTFKTLVTGDSLTAEHKGQAPFTFTPFATLLFSANAVPPSDDRSGAYTRRWAVLPFRPVGRRTGAPVRDLGKRVLLREAEGIIRKALGVLPDLLERGDFAVLKGAQDEFNERTDYLLTFVREELSFDQSDHVTSSKMLSAALEGFKVATGNQHSRTTVKHLEAELMKHGASKVQNHRVGTDYVWGVKGVRLKRPEPIQAQLLWGKQ